jgi:hypothetical protein
MEPEGSLQRSQEAFIGPYPKPDEYNVGFEVLTAVVMKSTIFWDITPCSPLKMEEICFFRNVG